MSTRKQLVVAFVALMVLFSGVAMVAGAAVASPTTVSTQDDSNDDGPDDTDTDDTDEDDDAAAEPTASVTFSDQTTDGTTVVVDEVTMDEGGFVTIHDSSLLVGNVIESVVGVSDYLEAGTHEDVKIEFNESLEEDETLIAMPHLDTNDNQEYDFVETEGAEDGPYVDENGEPVTDDAEFTLEEEEEAEEEAPEEEEEAEEEAPEEEEEAEEETEEETEEEAPDDDETVVMEPDHDAVEDGVTIVQQQATYVFIENLTIEELIIENAEVYVFVISDDADLDRLEEILEGEVDIDAPEDEEDAPDEDADDAPEDEEDAPDEDADDAPEDEEDAPDEDADDAPEDEEDAEEDDDAVAEPTASVTFSDQTTDGATVVVDEVTMDEGGFVTIHDSSLLDGDVIESVVGVSEYLEAGTHEDVEIELDESLEEDETLIAMPHLDTNDNQEYDFVETEGAEDGPYVDEDGEAVTDDAEVTLEEEEAPEDETDEDETDEDETDEDETDEDETDEDETDEDETDEDETDEDETDEDETDEDETDEDETDEDETDEDETDEDETDEDVEEAVSFTIDDLEAPENATVGDVITVNATITNPGEEEATQDVQFRLDGNLVESQSLTLGPEESETVTFEVDTADLEPGEYVHMVLTDEFGQVAFLTLEAADDATDEEPDDDGEETDENETGEEDNGEADRLAPIGALSPL